MTKKKQPRDTSWPPLGVTDLEPEIKPGKDNMKFPSLRQALERVVLEDDGTGPQKSSDGHTLYCPRGCCDNAS